MREGGAVTTNLLNDLLNLGVPQERANFYTQHYTAGHAVISVRADGREPEVANILSTDGATGYNDTLDDYYDKTMTSNAPVNPTTANAYDSANAAAYNDPNAAYNNPNAAYNDPNTAYDTNTVIRNNPNATYNDPNAAAYNNPNAAYNDPNAATRNNPNAAYNDPNAAAYNNPNATYNDPTPLHTTTLTLTPLRIAIPVLPTTTLAPLRTTILTLRMMTRPMQVIAQILRTRIVGQ